MVSSRKTPHVSDSFFRPEIVLLEFISMFFKAKDGPGMIMAECVSIVVDALRKNLKRS